jgi:hypothetical protein
MTQPQRPTPDSYALVAQHFERARSGGDPAQQAVDFQLADTYLRERVEGILQLASAGDIYDVMQRVESSAARMRAAFINFVAQHGPQPHMQHAFDLDYMMTSDGWMHVGPAFMPEEDPAQPAPDLAPIDIRSLRAHFRPEAEQVDQNRHDALARVNEKSRELSQLRKMISERDMVDLDYAPETDDPGQSVSL